MKIRSLLCLLLVFDVYEAHAQLNNNSFSLPLTFDSLKTDHWGVGFENLNFMRNTEYENLVDKGVTLFGYQLAPIFHFKVHDSVQLSGGIFLRKDFGQDGFNRIEPIFTLKIRKKGHQFIFGTLEGSTDHKLIEPLYHFENIITSRIENGFQHKYIGKRVSSDLWISWEKMIYKNSPFREEFTVGLSSEITLVKKRHFQWTSPVQVMIHHRGGEIDTSRQRVESQYNFAFGTKFTIPIEKSILKKMELQGYLNYYEDQSIIPADTFIDGLGQYTSLLFQFKHLGLMFNYWDSHQFQAPFGDPLFQSVSRKNGLNLFNYRKLAMFRILYEKEIVPGLIFIGRINNIYDFHMKSKDLVMEVYFHYRKTIDLGKVR